MKIKLTTLARVVGIAMCLGPWLFLEEPGKYWYWTSLLGAVLASIAGYNSQAKMMGMGEPGEELLRSWLNRIKKLIRRSN